MNDRKHGMKSVITTGLKYVFSMALLGAIVLMVIAAYISV